MELNSLDNKIVQEMLKVFGLCKLTVYVPAAWQSPYIEVSNSRWKAQYVPYHSRIYVHDLVKDKEWSSDGRLDTPEQAAEFIGYSQKEVYGE